MKATVSASRRMLIAFSTAPVIGTPKWASRIAGTLGAKTATVSPLPMPSPASAEASARQRRAVSRQVKRRSPCTAASRSGYTAAVRLRKLSGVSGAKLAAFLSSPVS